MALATLETLTPVHIGSGVTYNRNMDFVIDDKQIGIIDERKLLEIIGEENIHQWVSSIENNIPIIDFLQKGRGMKTVSLDKISHEVSVLKSLGTHAQNLKEHYRTSIKGVCIPGSSMKGAIKTAYWNNLIEPIIKEINESDLGFLKYDQIKKREVLKPKDQSMDKELFGDDPNSNAFRFLNIGDCHFDSLQTEVVEVSILNYLGNNKWGIKDDAPMLFESIPAGSMSAFNISIKQKHYDENKKKHPNKWEGIRVDFKDFCKQINEHTEKLIGYELDDLKKYQLNRISKGDHLIKSLNKVQEVVKNSSGLNQFVIRVGGNNGWDFTTGGWIKGLDTKKVSDKYFDDLQLAIQKKDRLNIPLWPKTRKVATTGDIFGFVKITLQP